MDARNGYRPDIDGLRALAVLLVLVFHGFPRSLPGGFIGVDIFFVISGYLITGILLSELQNQRFSVLGFYQRRVRRLFPALLAMMTACVAAGACLLLREENATLGKMILAGALSVANVWLYLGGGYFEAAAELNPLLHLWSLGVEEQFYLVWPLGLYWAHKSTSRLYWLLAGTIALSLALSIAGSGIWPNASFYLPFARLWELAAGGALAYWKSSGALARFRGLLARHLGEASDTAVAGLGAAAIAVGVLVTTPDMPFPGYIALLPVFGAVALIAVGDREPWTGRVLGSRPMVALGLISYPLYLWHWPLLAFDKLLTQGDAPPLRTALLLGLAVLLATLTYRWLELPLKKQRSHVLPGALVAGMAVVALAGFAGFRRWIPGIDPPAIYTLGVAKNDALRAAIPTRPCDGEPWVTPRATMYCQQVGGTDAPGQRTVVLWGDSHAGSWNYPFFEAARALGVRAVIFVTPGCAPLTGVRMTGWRATEGCREPGLGEAILESIEKLAPSQVVLVGRWSVYVHGWIVNGRLQQSSHFLTTSATANADAASSKRALAERLPLTIQALSRIAPTTVFETAPVLNTAPDSGLLRDRRGFEPTLTSHEEHQRFAHDVLQRALGPGVTLVNPAEKLCTPQKCLATSGDELLYTDDNHLTAQATLRFVPDMLRALGGNPDLSRPTPSATN